MRRVTDILGALVNCSRVVGRKDVSPEGTFPTVRPRTSPCKQDLPTCCQDGPIPKNNPSNAYFLFFYLFLSSLVYAAVSFYVRVRAENLHLVTIHKLDYRYFKEKVVYAMVVISMYYVCMYVCMVITYSRVWINRVRLPILLVVS